jgi:flagellar biosynthesis GTPase FlhF
MLLDTYFSKNRKGEYLKTCNGCRKRFKERNAKPEIKAERKKYRDEHKEERHIYDTQLRDKEKKKEQDLLYTSRPEIKEKARQRAKEWSKNNPERVKETREKNKPRIKERRKNDPAYRITCNLRNRVFKAVKKGRKSAHTMELLGCSVEELKEHLEKQFTEGMTFENYGEWHIDHILPCASFNLLEPEEQKKCFHYTNLQPLWASDNISKGAKLDWNK